MKHKLNGFAITAVLAMIFSVCVPLRVAAQGSATQVGIFKDYQFPLETRIEIPVEVKSVTGLYAIDMEIRFDPAVITFEDADPNSPGIQPALGTFLDAGLVVFNRVDNAAGIISFAMTQVNPSEPKSGSGNILVLYARGLKEGTSELRVSALTLSTREGQEIDAQGVDAALTVSQTAPVALMPTIQVQDPTKMIVIPTLAPTATPSPAPTKTAVPTATNTPIVSAVLDDGEADTKLNAVADEDTESFSLVSNWWIILVVIMLVAGVSVYLLSSKKRTDPKEE